MNTKDVFQADQYDFFLYKTKANELPLTPGKYNIPFGAYENAPPVAPEGMVARRIDGVWAVVEDHRKAVLYVVESGKPYTLHDVVEIGGASFSYDGGGPIPLWLPHSSERRMPVSAASSRMVGSSIERVDWMIQASSSLGHSDSETPRSRIWSNNRLSRASSTVGRRTNCTGFANSVHPQSLRRTVKT